MDFTFDTHKKLLESLLRQGFSFCTLNSYVSAAQAAAEKKIILRHDVEEKYEHALRFASIQHTKGIQGSYYFRILPKPRNEAIIREIASLGHEVGYHYDDLSECKGDYPRALERFRKNLAYLRQFAPVTTITMEGAPLSKYDNRDLWKKYDYKKLGILAEPYFDINFNELYYITDTARRWDGHLYNVRDKATKENPVTNPEFLKLRFHSTFDLINAIKASNPRSSNPASFPQQINKSTNQPISKSTTQQINNFPPQAMLNFHPQRWTNSPVPWVKELVWQNVKNQGKRMLLAMRK